MSYLDHLLEQIERARRYAKAMTNDADRQRFESIAAEYERELNGDIVTREPDANHLVGLPVCRQRREKG